MTRYTKIHDFHGSRAAGIGASDIPILAGFTKQYRQDYRWKKNGIIEKLDQTPYTLYLVKKGFIEQLGAGPRAGWGHKLEPLILSTWIERNRPEGDALPYLLAALRGKSSGVYKTLTEARRPGRPYVLAHSDLIIDEGEGVNIEGKSSGYYAGKRREGEAFMGYSEDDLSYQGIPDPVYLQVQYQDLTYDPGESYVAVLIDTGDYREYGPILADTPTQEKELALAERFWWCLENDKPPKPETWGDVASMWPLPNDLTAMVGGEEELKARAWVDEYWKLGDTLERADSRRRELKNALGILIGENSVLSTPGGVKLASSWIQANPASVDLKGLQTGEPELYARLVEGGYVKRSERRELRPAKIKGE